MKEKLILALIRMLSWLPFSVIRSLGNLIGTLGYLIPNRESRNARINLEVCFPELNEAERRKLLRQTLRESAITILEMPKVWYGRTQDWLARLDSTQARREVEELLKQGKGLIFAMPHLGNFELSAHFVGSIGKGTGLYRPPRQGGLEAAMLEGRNRPGQNRMVPTDRQGIKELYLALSRNEMILILPDQRPKSDKGGAGVFAPFFGKPALTMTLVNRFAAKSGAPVYFVAFIRTQEAPGYRVIGQLAAPEIASQDPVIAATALNQGVEALVRQCPAQYQWTYRRFSAQPGASLSPYTVR